MSDRPLYRCHECDDWKPTRYCPDCGNPCAMFVHKPKRPTHPTGEASGDE